MAEDNSVEVGEADNELETASKVTTAGPFRIRNYHSGSCLEVPGNSKANSVQIDQWSCIRGRKTNEDWYLDFVDDNFFRIRNRHSGKCMNVEGNSWYNGARIIQYTCGNYQNELFYKTLRKDNFFWIVGTSGRGFNIEGASQDNGARLIQWDLVDLSNEYFEFTASPD